MVKLFWVRVDDNTYRARVIGGWLVKVVSEVMTNLNPDSHAEDGYEWRDSVCFVPDPEGRWDQWFSNMREGIVADAQEQSDIYFREKYKPETILGED